MRDTDGPGEVDGLKEGTLLGANDCVGACDAVGYNVGATDIEGREVVVGFMVGDSVGMAVGDDVGPVEL